MKIYSAGVVAIVVAGCASPASQPAKALPQAEVLPPSTPARPAASQPQPAAGPSATPASETTSRSKAEPPVGSPRERLMRSHFKETEVIRAAVIRGDLSATIAPAEALAKLEGLGKISDSWRPSIEALKAASTRISNSSDIPRAAAGTADIGRACGACHALVGGPMAKVGTPPDTQGDLKARMKRHVWATERLWEGLYVPSGAAWNAGAAALTREPFPKEVLNKGGVHTRSAGSRFKKLASTAGSKKRPEDRAQLYASLLETCSACHTLLKGER